MLASLAYAWDYRGAMNKADAPGRVTPQAEVANMPPSRVASMSETV
jgi:hypothetical protein